MLRDIYSGQVSADRVTGRRGLCTANIQTFLLVFMTLGILAAGAVIVSFAIMCREHLHNIPSSTTGGKNMDEEGVICKAVYRPGDQSVAFAEVLRMLVAFIAVTSMFTVCGICCCYHLSVARDQTERLKAVLGHYNIPDDPNALQDFKQYLAIALKNDMSPLESDYTKPTLPDDDRDDDEGRAVQHALIASTEQINICKDKMSSPVEAKGTETLPACVVPIVCIGEECV